MNLEVEGRLCSGLLIPTLPLRRKQIVQDRDDLDGLDPAASRVVLEECLRFSAGEAVLIEQTCGETLSKQAPESHGALLRVTPDYDVRRLRLEMFEPVADEFSLSRLGDSGPDFPADFDSSLKQPLILLYSALYPILFGARNRVMVDLNSKEVSKAAQQVNWGAKSEQVRNLTASIATLLSVYETRWLSRIKLAPRLHVEGFDRLGELLRSERYRQLAEDSFGLGIPEFSREVESRMEAFSKEISSSSAQLLVGRSRFQIARKIPRFRDEHFSEVIGDSYLPPIVATRRLGPEQRELAKVGEAYTHVPLYARQTGAFWTKFFPKY